MDTEVYKWLEKYSEQWHRDNGLADLPIQAFPMPRPNTQLAEAIERINREIVAGLGLPSDIVHACNRPADDPEPVNIDELIATAARLRGSRNDHVDSMIHYQVDRDERHRRQKKLGQLFVKYGVTK